MPDPMNITNLNIFSKPEDQKKYISVTLLRPEDLLSLELRFLNFTLHNQFFHNEHQTWLQKNSGQAFMMVLFQSQSIAEECGIEKVGKLTPPGSPAKILMSGNSKLVFKVNKNFISLNANDLLNWDDFELVVNSRAKGFS